MKKEAVNPILPEGCLLHTAANKAFTRNPDGLAEAFLTGAALEAMVARCDGDHNLWVNIAGVRAVIPRAETVMGAEDGTVKEIAILSRVGKPVCFKVADIFRENGRIMPVLSRRMAQEEALTSLLSSLIPGDVIGGRITHLSNFGAFVDIGRGITSMIGIENISVSRIRHPSDRFTVGQDIYAAVLSIEREARRINLTHKELLGTWEQNAGMFSAGMTVEGIVRGTLDYGVFVELSPNLSGLAEPREGLLPGQHLSVYIKSISYERMKIKLVIIEKLPSFITRDKPLRYFQTSGRISCWQYHQSCFHKKKNETLF